MQIPHKPVLLNEVLSLFKNVNKGDFLDCTLGYAGHSEAMLKQHLNLNLIACDQDQIALEFSKKRLMPFEKRINLYHCNFSEILDKIKTQNLRAILADIGVSSLQLDQNERGFSIHSDFLDMRMNQKQSLSAYEVINTYTQEQLAYIFKEYGELNDSWFLAEKICKARSKKNISSAKELCEIIGMQKISGRKVLKNTLIFQALRIEVNNELGVLKQFLEKLENLKFKDCLVAFISFHSLEDRMVKKFFKMWSKGCICDERAMKCECGGNHSLGHIVTKKAIIPSKEEISLNSRAACAKMRAFYFKG